MGRLLSAFIAAILFVSLILFAATHGWYGLSLKNEVRPLEAITLAVNLLIALFLQRFFTTKINDLRAEKNVLIDASKEMIRLLIELSERTTTQVQQASIDEQSAFAIISGFRRLANAITDLEESINMSHLRSVKRSLPALRSEFFALKAVATSLLRNAGVLFKRALPSGSVLCFWGLNWIRLG
jgi:hypothetical protein